MHRSSWAPAEVDITRPSEARVHDFFLGGSHNFASDRAFAHALLAACPGVPAFIRENRGFLLRAVRHLAAAGVDQFLDLGSGILTAGSVHEVAEAAIPDARVVYVDLDPVAITHGRTLLAGHPRAHMVDSDLLDGDRVLAEAVHEGGLDLSRPVGLLAVGVLHFVPDARQAAEVLARYLGAFAPGSHLAISHVVPWPGDPGPGLFAREPTLRPLVPRTGPQIGALFGDVTIVAPGLVAVPAWRPCPAEARAVRDHDPVLAGLGRRH